MKLSLVVTTPGKQAGKVIEIKQPQFLVGRDPDCQLRPASPLISKRHCALEQRDNKAFLKDFGSTNGSFINDEQVKGEAELNNGDRVKIGPLLFEVRLETEAPVNRPTPAPATKGAPKPAPKPGAASSAAPAAKKAPAPAAASSSEDDEMAALLLSGGGEDDSDAPSPAAADMVPEGSTVHELILPPPKAPEEASKQEGKPPEKGGQNKPAPSNTAQAAQALLEKYMRRPRG